jgi:(2Fe-2S) ferredoxin
MTMAKKIGSPNDLAALRDRTKAEIDLRMGLKEMQITIHMGTCGIAAGARDVLTQLAAELSEASVGNVTLRQSGCAGLCDQEPMVTLTDKAGKQFRYGKLDKRKVRNIVQEHVLGGRPVAEYIMTV